MEIYSQFEKLYQFGEANLIFDNKQAAKIVFHGESFGPFAVLYIPTPEPRFLKNRPLRGTLVLANKTTTVSSKRIIDLGGCYFDLQGNYEFTAHSKQIIHRVIAFKNPSNLELDRFLNVSNHQACQVLFACLKSSKPLKARDIQKTAQVSLGLVGRIAHCLVQNSLLNKTENGYCMEIGQKRTLLERWKTQFQNVSLPAMQQARYTSLLSLRECVQTIQEQNLPLVVLNEETSDPFMTAPKVLFSKTPDFAPLTMPLSMIEDPKNGSTTIYYLDSTFLSSLCPNHQCSPFLGFLMGTKKVEDILPDLS